jgi:hypothetical protein
MNTERNGNPENEFHIETLSQKEFTSILPSLERFQQLVYSIYTPNGEPQSLMPDIPDSKYKIYRSSPKNTVFFIAKGNFDNLFQKPASEHLLKLEKELRSYNNVAGFFKVEWGSYSPGVNLPLEAMLFIEDFKWPAHRPIAHVASFTVNPLLPRKFRVEVLRGLYESLNTYAINERISERLYTILGKHVVPFVEATGVRTEQFDAALNTGGQYALSVFKAFPRYWNDCEPKLYRFILGGQVNSND